MSDDPDQKDEDQLFEEIQARYESAKQHASAWRTKARRCYQFYIGDQWSEEEMRLLDEQQRPVVSFNRTKRLVDAVIGHEANNRAEVRYIPRTMDDAKLDELLTSGGKYFRDQCDAEFEESDAFRDTCICGMGWTQDRLSDAENPDYDLIEERVDPMEMLWDPSSQKPNLADARYVFRRKRYTRKEIKAIWPDFKGPFQDALDDETDDLNGTPHESNPRERYRDDDTRQDVKPDVLVVEYQYKEKRAFYAVQEPPDPQTGQGKSFEVDADKIDDSLKARMEKGGAQLSLKRKTITQRCFVIGRTIVQGPDVVCPHDFTYHCITGFRDREKNHWHGIVHSLIDPQRWSNKWLAQIMHILNVNAKGGVMMEESAVSDMNQFKASWADPGQPTVFADGALKDGRVIPKEPPLYPQGVDKLLEYANASFTDVSGVNQELLGLADREQPGVLEWQRKQSAVTLLAPLFDSLRRFRRLQGRTWLYMMAKYVSDGRMIRITQDQAGQAPMESNIPFQLPSNWRADEVLQYDVIVDQASSAPNQKEQTWSVISQLAGVAKEMFMNPPVMLWALKYSPLPESAFEELREIAAQEAQKPQPPSPEMVKAQAQVQAKQAELQLKQEQAQIDMQLKQQEAALQIQIERQKAEQEMAIERYKAEQQFQVEQMKAAHQATMMQQQMSLDQQRAQFDAGLDQQKMDRESKLADHKMSLEAQAQGMKSELSAAKEVGSGPISKLLDGITKSGERGAQSSEKLTGVLAQLAKTLGEDSQNRNKAIGEILKRRQAKGR